MSDPNGNRSIQDIFADARKVLESNKPLSWSLGQEAMKASLQTLDTPDGQCFIEECLLRILTMMTQQSPGKLGPSEKTIVEESLWISLKVSLKLLVKHPNLLSLIARTFDPKIPFYHGTKTGYSFNPGFPQIRFQAAKKFLDHKGFALILEVLKRPDCPWPGSETVLIILNMLNTQELAAEDRLKEAYIGVLMDRLLQLPDDILKKESTEATGNLLTVIGTIHTHCGTAAGKNTNRYQETFYQFWFRVILKFMNSSSLVIKLFGWEQLNDLISEIKSIRPLPGTFTVEGAGTEFANGVYTATTKNPDAECLQYTKPPSGGGPLLTLFRCTMRNTKAKWWFISQADLEKPGTDKDIDYYLHKSSPDDEREPPAFGWTRNNPGMNLIGQEPAPVLKRGNILLPKGLTREMCIDAQMIDWTLTANILSLAFTSSIHRETVSRTTKYLLFLAEYDALSEDQIRLVWKSGLHSNDHDVMEEIFHILVQLCPVLSSSRFSFLMDLAAEGLKTEDFYSRIVRFVEKFSSDDYKYMNAIHTPAMQMKLLSLLWVIYTRPESESLKSSSIIQELLTYCFKQPSGKEMAFEKILECRSLLVDFAALTIVEEMEVAKVMQTLQFLISRFNGSNGFAEELNRLQLIDPIVKEIHRFIFANRGVGDQKWYATQLSGRFQVLRRHYVISNCVDLSVIHQLWAVVRENVVETEEFFVFLKGDTSNGTFEHMFSNPNLLAVFTDVLCNDSIDWSSCGDAAFECFRAYANELETYAAYFPVGTELPPRLGLQTLWKIVLSIPSDKAQREATNLLLQDYDALILRQEEVRNDLLKIIFDNLQEYLERVKTGGIEEVDRRRAERCVSILTSAVQKFGSAMAISHTARSCMSRMTISVYYRRSYYHPTTTTHYDSVRVDRGSDGMIKVEVHPFHTIKILKTKIAEALKTCTANNVNIDNQFQYSFHDGTRLYELSCYEGQEISVSYQVSYQRQFDDDLYGNHNSLTNNNYMGLNRPTNPSIGGGMNAGTANAMEDNNNFSQLVVEDFSKFDCLLSLCQETSGSLDLAYQIWDLLMLLPTQPDLLDMIQSTANANDSGLLDSPTNNSNAKTWDQIFDVNSVTFTRRAYLLQIIDAFLRPAPEVDSAKIINESFRQNFLQSEGLELILQMFFVTPTNASAISFATLAVCLHSLYYLIFETTTNESGEVASVINEDCVDSLVTLEESKISQLLEKLLYVAHHAAAKENSSVVHSALVIITLLIRSPKVASQLISNDYSKALLGTVLRSTAKKVREIASNFAVQVGKAQPIVYSWLIQEVEKVEANDELCSELFHALMILSVEGRFRNNTHDQEDRRALAQILSKKLLNYPRDSNLMGEERYALLGYLQLFNQLINTDVQLVMSTPIGPQLIHILLSEFLFVLNPASDVHALCDTPSTRRSAFQILSYLVRYDPESFEVVLQELLKFSKQASKRMHYYWGLQVSHDIKKSDIKYTGLKNQGCTCYSNSVLQMLFMSPKFREAVLATPLREIHRTSIWHRTPEELVNTDLLFEWANGSWRLGRVAAYDPELLWHTIHYFKADGSIEEQTMFNIHEGRLNRETGRVRVVPSPDDTSEPLSEREEGAFRVLEQLQRTFCFLKLTKRKYFDPRPLVDACKTLNLNFNVYHQNDATEFCDQLLDRIETATKGKYTKKDMWKDVFLRDVFGGKWLTQKIPTDCEIFNKEKEACGHWQSSRVEDYLKVELIVRGKEKIDESLEGLVEGELMDGDNKIQCEVCTQKKATNRRTCFGALPNTLILHLKRFDLDFQTFETVKLNSKMTFPTVINMLKYTKEGIELAEAEKSVSSPNQGANSSKELAYQSEHPSSSIDASDFEYELQGVLVHAGVAQGGHYYSFIRDTDSEDRNKWYRFDDEDVTPFNPENIPIQCFGGSSGTSPHHLEDDRTANALMLFYSKKKKGDETSLASESNDPNSHHLHSEGDQTPPRDLIDGLQAFQREVMESNLQHLLTCYLVDPELHNFVRGIISAISDVPISSSEDDAPLTTLSLQWSPTTAKDDLPLRTVKFGCEFLLNVVLHCRERPAVRSSVSVMKGMFEKYPHTAQWFVSEVLTTTTCTWWNDYLVSCSDALARATFVQLLVQAVTVIAPKDPQVVVDYQRKLSTMNESRASFRENPVAICCFLNRALLDLVFRSVSFSRHADELFVLIRDLAAIPSLCIPLKQIGIISFLCFFIMSDQVPPIVRSLFDKFMSPSKQQQLQQQPQRLEYGHLLQSVFEAIAALLGVPQIRKINLLQEKTYWDSELVPAAKDAFTIIFNEVSRNGVMETADGLHYLERVSGSTNQKTNGVLVRSMLDRFGSHVDGKLYLDGFLSYQADVASYNPKQVWRDLHAFGFRNDLSRAPPRHNHVNNNGESQPSTGAATEEIDQTAIEVKLDEEDEGSVLATLTENCRNCLSNIAFYESGLVACEPAARAIAQKICYRDMECSGQLIHQALARLHLVVQDSSWSHHPVSLVTDFLRLMLLIDDGLQINRLHVILFSKYGLATIALQEKDHPSNVRVNEYNKTFLCERYITLIQDLMQVKGALESLIKLAKEDPKVRTIKGMLRLRPGSNLTDAEDTEVRNLIVRLEGAGVPEINGDYHFTDLKNHAGYYSRIGAYREKEMVKYTLYKCSLRNGGFQWFISVTPDHLEPGTTSDIDFYYAPAKVQDYLPPTQWIKLNAQPSRDPPPKVTFIRKEPLPEDEEGVSDETTANTLLDPPFIPNDSDSDRESLQMISEDPSGLNSPNDSSFL